MTFVLNSDLVAQACAQYAEGMVDPQVYAITADAGAAHGCVSKQSRMTFVLNSDLVAQACAQYAEGMVDPQVYAITADAGAAHVVVTATKRRTPRTPATARVTTTTRRYVPAPSE